MKNTIKENKNNLIVCAISFLLAIICLVIYSIVEDEYAVTMYLQILGTGIVPLAALILLLLLKQKVSLSWCITLAAFIFLASDLGTALRFYNKIWFWDLLMHGGFGVLCSLFMRDYLIKEENYSSKWKYYVVIFLAVLGVAAVWEIFEYGCDCIFHQDAQKVYFSMEQGKSPVSDTMEDIMITAVGSAIAFVYMEIAARVTSKKMIEPKSEEK